MRYAIDVIAQSPDPITNIVSVIPGAEISVFVRNTDGSSGSAATVYQIADPSNLTVLTQPFTTDSAGRIPGWLASGDYNIEVSKPGFTTQVTPVSFPSGTTPGAIVIRSFSFSFNNSGLDTAIPVGWTPGIGDVLYDAWFNIHIAWNTPAWGDIGLFTNSSNSGVGFYGNGPGFVVDMTQGDHSVETFSDGAIQTRQASSFSQLAAFNTAWKALTTGTPRAPQVDYVRYNPSPIAPSVPPSHPSSPILFTVSNPLKVVVSSDGSTTGGNPGATQGTATLYLVTSTPI